MSAPSPAEVSATDPPVPRRQFLPTVFVWVGAAVLVGTLFVGWYVVQLHSGGGCSGVVETLYPLWVVVNGSGSSCPSSEVLGYSSAGLPSTGVLYLGVAALTATGAALAFLVGALLLRGRRIHRGSLLLVLALLAILTAWLGPAIVALEQPSTVCGDQGAFPAPFGSADRLGEMVRPGDSVGGASGACDGWAFPGGNSGVYAHTYYAWVGGSGPWASFFGSVSSRGPLSSISATFSWGPGVGWFLDIWGVALIGVGTAISRKH